MLFKAIKAASDEESVGNRLSGMSLIALEGTFPAFKSCPATETCNPPNFFFFAGLFSSLSYFFCANGSHATDYQLALQRYVKREGGE